MPDLIKRIKTLFWFLRKPQYIPHIFQILKREKITENTKDEAVEWCLKNEVSQQEAIYQVTGNNNFVELNVAFPEIIKEAHFKMISCPVKMGGEGATSFLYNVTKSISVKHILETGVAYGWSSLALLLAIKDIEGAKLISNDMPYIKMENDDFVGCIVPQFLRSKWDLQRLPDVTGIPLALEKFNNKIDICHYDSDKSYSGRMFAYPLLWDALRKGGIFISDDIHDNIAFKQFSDNVHRKPFIFNYRNKFVGVLKK